MVIKTHWHQPSWMGGLPLWIKQQCHVEDLDFWSLIHWPTQFMMKSWYFLLYWHFVRGIDRWTVDSPKKTPVTQALIFFYVILKNYTSCIESWHYWPFVTGRFPSQRASNAETIFMWWHHQVAWAPMVFDVTSILTLLGEPWSTAKGKCY